MKIITKVLAIIAGAITLSCFSSAHSYATAEPVEPFNIPARVVKNGDMKLSNIFVSATQEGTIIVAPSGILATGGVLLPSTGSAVKEAQLTISGQPGYMFAITLPLSCLISDAEEHGMDATDFTSTPAIGTLDEAGRQIVQIGATLHVSAAQPAGLYANTQDVSVTVNYN